VLQKRKAELLIKQPNITQVDTYSDYRKILDRKDIDIVIVGTPDHWHALQMINACSAGKHVYVEKPAGNSIGECNAMIAAKNKYNRIVQVGQWQRSQ
jgi:predicted dehydrogenase